MDFSDLAESISPPGRIILQIVLTSSLGVAMAAASCLITLDARQETDAVRISGSVYVHLSNMPSLQASKQYILSLAAASQKLSYYRAASSFRAGSALEHSSARSPALS